MDITLKSGAESVKLPPGEYIIGDPCYHVPDDQWDRVLDESNFFEDQCWATFTTHDGRTGHVIAFSTKYGDGVYSDQNGRQYGVDAGLIGIIAVDDLDPASIDLELAHQVEFVQSFHCEAEGGRLMFGRVTIDTDGGDDEVVDDDDDWNNSDGQGGW